MLYFFYESSDDMNSSKIKFRILVIISIVLLCIGFTIKEFQNDNFYIIKLGGDILKNGIDLLDHYSWVADLNYTYPHWLYDVIMYLVYSSFGNIGIYISTIVLFIVLILVIYIVNLKINKNEFMGLLVAALSVFGLYGFVTARAQLPSYILLLLEVYYIEKLIESGNKRYVFYLCFISLLVANMHATIWLVCFIFYLPYIGEYVIHKFNRSNFINKLKNKRVKFELSSSSQKVIIENVGNIKLVFIAMGISFLMGIFSPSRICYTYVFKIMMGDSQSFIFEHYPLVVLHSPIFLVMIGIVFLILAFTKVKIKLRDLFMIFGLSFMCLTASRHVALFVIIGILFISRLCCSFFDLENDRTFDILYSIIVSNKMIYILLFIFILCIGCNQFYKNSKNDFIELESYPVYAVEYIKSELDYQNIRLYNDYNFGSYLLFNDIPVFIDSRCDLYLSEFNGLDYSIFDDEVNIINDYEKKFDFYDVTHVLIEKDDILYKVLVNDSSYKILYQDKYFILFERGEIYEN